ncbi:MAG: hypothetical protein HY231_23925 [Acidobacteria bacterium]|nr:hypothetical protein [Acidobacteriota bacterium]
MKKLFAILFLIAMLCLAPAPKTNAEVIAKSWRPRAFTFAAAEIRIRQIGTDSEGRLYVRLTASRDDQFLDESRLFVFQNPPIRTLGGLDPERALEEIVGEAVRVAYNHPAYFATLTVYPDPNNPASVACDGDMGTNGNASYATAHSTADCADCSGSSLLTAENSGSDLGSGTTYSVIRSVLNFDASALGSGSTISAATLSVKPASQPFDYTGAATLQLVTNSVTSNVAYNTSDFNSFGTTDQATAISWSALSANTYADFTLNSTGRGNISKTGVSHFGLRASQDVSNTQPTLGTDPGFSNQGGEVCYFYGSETTGTTSDPKLVITYTPAAGSMGRRIYWIG